MPDEEGGILDQRLKSLEAETADLMRELAKLGQSVEQLCRLAKRFDRLLRDRHRQQRRIERRIAAMAVGIDAFDEQVDLILECESALEHST